MLDHVTLLKLHIDDVAPKDGWNTIVSFWGPACFQVQTALSFREFFRVLC